MSCCVSYVHVHACVLAFWIFYWQVSEADHTLRGSPATAPSIVSTCIVHVHFKTNVCGVHGVT